MIFCYGNSRTLIYHLCLIYNLLEKTDMPITNKYNKGIKTIFIHLTSIY